MSPIGLILIGIIIGIIITIIMIYVVKGGFKGIPSYEDRKHKKELEIYAELSAFKTEEKEKIDAELKIYRQKIDEELKVRRLEIDEELRVRKQEINDELIAHKQEVNNELMARKQEVANIIELTKSNAEQCEKQKIAAYESYSAQLQTYQTIIDKKQNEIENLEQKKKLIEINLKEYEDSIIQAKKRIIRHRKYEREQEIKELEHEYDELVINAEKAISLIRNRMSEWSATDRACYEERLSREDVAKRNRLNLSSTATVELKELYEACSKLKLANPIPLYKAIYEIYLRGPVKDLGVNLGAVGVCGIYKIVNVVNDKVYVGQSVDIAERWKQHIKRGCKCEVGTMTGAGLYDAMWEYGVWNFSFQIIEKCEKSDLTAHEKMWIDYFQSNEIGYNKRL